MDAKNAAPEPSGKSAAPFPVMVGRAMPHCGSGCTHGDICAEWPAQVKPVYKSKNNYKNHLEEHVEELSELQRQHYASNRYAVLLIFKAMDAAGKDGSIRHVMSGVNPQGCQVFIFKHPSAVGLEHDFLWRTTQALPERGRIGW